MGCVSTIGHDRFPRQGDWVGKRVEVTFHYDARTTVGGVFVRDDRESPGVGIILLDDGRYVLTTECQHSHPR